MRGARPGLASADTDIRRTGAGPACDADDPGVDEDTTTPLEFVIYPDPVIVTAGKTTTAHF